MKKIIFTISFVTSLLSNVALSQDMEVHHQKVADILRKPEPRSITETLGREYDPLFNKVKSETCLQDGEITYRFLNHANIVAESAPSTIFRLQFGTVGWAKIEGSCEVPYVSRVSTKAEVGYELTYEAATKQDVAAVKLAVAQGRSNRDEPPFRAIAKSLRQAREQGVSFDVYFSFWQYGGDQSAAAPFKSGESFCHVENLDYCVEILEAAFHYVKEDIPDQFAKPEMFVVDGVSWRGDFDHPYPEHETRFNIMSKFHGENFSRLKKSLGKQEALQSPALETWPSAYRISARKSTKNAMQQLLDHPCNEPESAEDYRACAESEVKHAHVYVGRPKVNLKRVCDRYLEPIRNGQVEDEYANALRRLIEERRINEQNLDLPVVDLSTCDALITYTEGKKNYETYDNDLSVYLYLYANLQKLELHGWFDFSYAEHNPGLQVVVTDHLRSFGVGYNNIKHVTIREPLDWLAANEAKSERLETVVLLSEQENADIGDALAPLLDLAKFPALREVRLKRSSLPGDLLDLCENERVSCD